MDLRNADSMLIDSSDGLEDSEDDWDRSMFQSKENIGKRKAEEIIANQAEDRIISKRNARKLTYAIGAPGTRDAAARVQRHWDAFYGRPNVNVDTCPSGEMIFRFIDTISRRTNSGIHGKNVPSLRTIQGIWYQLIELLKFRHRDLHQHYGPTDAKRIQVHLDQLVHRHLLTKGRWFRREWLGVLTVHRIARNWLEVALADGCRSWDHVLLKVTGMVLQSALAARVGEVALSKGHTGNKCLCWKHIELTLTSTNRVAPSIQHLRGKFTLKYCKGQKDTPNEENIVFIDPLRERSMNAICVIKLLMILALRFGHVHGRSLHEVLEYTSRSGSVKWRNPNFPVMCQIKRGAESIRPEAPANVAQLQNNIKEMGLAAGVLTRLTSHSLRYGALRDAAHLAGTVKGIEIACAGLIAGHGESSTGKKITRRYVGPIQETIYNRRAESEFKDRLAPKFGSQGFPRKIRSEEVDEYMITHGMDTASKPQRAVAARALRTQQIEHWQEAGAEEQVAEQPETQSSTQRKSGPRPGRGKILVLPVQKVSAADASVSDAFDGSHGEENFDRADTVAADDADQHSFFDTADNLFPDAFDGSHGEKNFDGADTANDTNLTSFFDKIFAAVDDNDAEVDPATLEAFQSIVLCDRPNGDDAEEDEPDFNLSALETANVDPEGLQTLGIFEQTLIEEHLSDITAEDDDVVSTEEKDFANPVDLEADKFVSWFASINVFKLQQSFSKNDIGEARKWVVHGNSRDDPIPFMWHCGNQRCEFSTASVRALHYHQNRCKGMAPPERTFSCTDCKKIFIDHHSLKGHIRAYHKWVPRPCHLCPTDDQETLYHDILAFQRHLLSAHEKFSPPVACPLHDSGCRTKKLYTSRTGLRSHLEIFHRKTPAEAAASMPAKRPRAPRHRQSLACPIIDCALPNTSKKISGVRDHLIRKHGFSEEQALQLVPLNKLELTYAEKREENKGKLKPEKPRWKCPVDGCQTKALFESRRNRRQHLMGVHKWDTNRALEYVPLSKSEETRAKHRAAEGAPGPAVPRRRKWHCPVQGCVLINISERKREHLQKAHGWTKDQVMALLPLTKNEITRARTREEKQSSTRP